jgi:hypothetical protein
MPTKRTLSANLHHGETSLWLPYQTFEINIERIPQAELEEHRSSEEAPMIRKTNQIKPAMPKTICIAL